MTPAIRALEAAGVTFTVHEYDHDPTHGSYGTEAAEVLGVDPDQVFKTLLVDADGELVVAIVPVAGQLSLKAAGAAVGAKRVKLAEPAVAQRATGYVLGGISPFGQRKRHRTVIDGTCARFAVIYVSAGRRGLEVAVAPTDLIGILGAVRAPIASWF